MLQYPIPPCILLLLLPFPLGSLRCGGGISQYLLVRGDDVIIEPLVKLGYDVTPGVRGGERAQESVQILMDKTDGRQSTPTSFLPTLLPSSPGVDRQLRVEYTGGDAELFQEQFESVAPLHCPNKHQGLALNQVQFQQGVDEQELVLFLTLNTVLLQLGAVWQLGALQL